ncbi:MAG TPA: cell wall hydrolase [Steroidobacteraceae bacterium]|jgi:spore germination cell wall hydrolase CwlJ-like protein|nr:cell wall hydrolase [Steroidobacteraceae bacterium]
MLRSLLCEARIWLVDRRSRPHFYWLAGAKDNLGFLAMLGLPAVALMSIVCFAYSGRTRVEPALIEAERRNAAAAQQRALDLECLAENIYFEARGEPLDGQRAVAEVTLNRTRSPYFPHTICAVVHETQWDPLRRRLVAHFSWTELSALSEPTGSAWKQAMTVASAAYDDTYIQVVPGALFYHATSIRPDWARTKTAVATIGNHIFYR